MLYADKDGKQQVQKARVVCVAGNSIESPRLLLNSASAKFPDGLANSSGQVGRNYMRHLTGSVYAAFEQAGAHVPRHDHGRDHPGRGRATTRSAASSAATSWRPCRWACRSWRRSSIPAPGAGASPARWSSTRTWPACGSSARTCRRSSNGVTLSRPRRTSSACRSPTSTSTTTPTTSRCAATPSGRAPRSTRRRVRPTSTRPRPIPARTIWAPTG